MTIFRRYEEYQGYIINQTVIHLRNDEKNLKDRLESTRKAIQKEQDKCDHIYQFWCSGVYKDNYICLRCGETNEH